MAELFETTEAMDQKKREVFLIRAFAIAKQMERDKVNSLIRFLVDNKLNELRFQIAEADGDATKYLQNDYRFWKNFMVEFDQLLKSILEKEPSNAR